MPSDSTPEPAAPVLLKKTSPSLVTPTSGSFVGTTSARATTSHGGGARGGGGGGGGGFGLGGGGGGGGCDGGDGGKGGGPGLGGAVGGHAPFQVSSYWKAQLPTRLSFQAHQMRRLLASDKESAPCRRNSGAHMNEEGDIRKRGRVESAQGGGPS